MFDPSMQANPWMTGAFGNAQAVGMGWPQFAQLHGFAVSPYAPAFGFQGPLQNPQGISPLFWQGAVTPQLAPQTWYGNPVGVPAGLYANAVSYQAVQQIPQLMHHAQQIAQQVPQLIPQIPQLIQQNPQLLQQAPQLQQIPQVLQQAAILAQQVPQVLQALCASPQSQVGSYGATPTLSGFGGYRPLTYGQTAFA